MYRLFVWQTIIVSLTGGVILLGYGSYYAISIFYGGTIAIVASLLLGWRLKRLSTSVKVSGFVHIYIGALERFVLVVAGMAIGMGWLRLSPFPIIMGFAVAQLGYLFKLPDRPT
jgi:ATP synthase protein I